MTLTQQYQKHLNLATEQSLMMRAHEGFITSHYTAGKWAGDADML